MPGCRRPHRWHDPRHGDHVAGHRRVARARGARGARVHLRGRHLQPQGRRERPRAARAGPQGRGRGRRGVVPRRDPARVRPGRRGHLAPDAQGRHRHARAHEPSRRRIRREPCLVTRREHAAVHALHAHRDGDHDADRHARRRHLRRDAAPSRCHADRKTYSTLPHRRASGWATDTEGCCSRTRRAARSATTTASGSAAARTGSPSRPTRRASGRTRPRGNCASAGVGWWPSTAATIHRSSSPAGWRPSPRPVWSAT